MSTVVPDVCEPLLERDDSVSVLSSLLAAVRADSTGRLVWIRGEAGVGKTALLRHFCEMQAGPTRVLRGACEPLRTPRPLGPWVDVAEATGGALAERVAAAARPYEVAAALLEELRGRRPTVVVVEDLHWADEATLDVMTLLASRIGSAPALVLASYRDDELDRAPALRLVLGETAGRARRLKVESLSPVAVAALASPHGLDSTELYSRTNGNPFFVTEVLAAGGERLPDTVRDAVLARAARLPGPSQRLLETVAIVPGQIEIWLLQEVAGELIEHLQECLASGMLTAGAANVGFRHELARLATEEAIAPDRRLTLHRRVLAALAARGAGESDLARLTHHAEGAADREGVLRWAPRAAERAAASGAHREAAAHYDTTLRFAEGVPPTERAALLERRAEECYMSAQIDAAIVALREALRSYRELRDPLREGNALRVLSRTLFFVGKTAEGETAGDRAVELLEQLPPGHELAIAYCNVSQRRMVVEDADGAATWGARALAMAEQLGDPEALVYALTNIGSAELDRGEETGREKLERALALARQHGFEDHVGRIFHSLAMWPVRMRRFADSEQPLAAGLDYCNERGLDTWRLYLLACEARLELDRGRWDAAADTAASVLRDPHSASLARNWVLIVLGLIRARRGDAEAAAALQEAQSLAESTEELMRIGPTGAARAELAWLTGDSDGVIRATDDALALALERRVPWVVGELACWRWRAGLDDRLAPELIAAPYRLSIAGDWRRAADRWREIGCPYETALALADADDEDALREAIAELQALGARPAAAIVARRMRERGVRGVPRGPRPSTRENPAGLTSRELDVLALLAEGMRNAQIAQRLVVSEKTVDHHVSAILRKLDVRTRAEAAAHATRLGLTD